MTKVFPNTKNSTGFGQKHTSQEAIEDFVDYIVSQLKLEDLHRLNACLIDVEFFMQDQQAFRNSTLAKSMLRAEITRYQASDEQAINRYLKPHVDRIEKNLLHYQAGSMKKNRRQCLGTFLTFNLKLEEDIFEKVFDIMLANTNEDKQVNNAPVITTSKPASVRVSSSAVRVLPPNLSPHTAQPSSMFALNTQRRNRALGYRQSLSLSTTPAQLLNDIMTALNNINRLEKPLTFNWDLSDAIDNIISLLTFNDDEHLENNKVRDSLKRCPLFDIDLQALKKRALEVEQICKEYTALIAKTSSLKLTLSADSDNQKQQEEEKKDKSRLISDILTLISRVGEELAKTNSTFSQTKTRMAKANLVTDNAWTWLKIEALLKSDSEQKTYKELDIDTKLLAQLLADINIIHKVLINQESILGNTQEQDKRRTQILEQTLSKSNLFPTSPSQSKPSQTGSSNIQSLISARKFGF